MRNQHRHVFDFSQRMAILCDDICHRVEVFQHINMSQVVVTFAQARRRVLHGIQAKLTPMRFENGSLTKEYNGRDWTVRRMTREGVEVLYLLTFYLPRFLDQTYREKMITVMHELYHISPEFNGDIRRFSGRCHVHTHSQKEYDKQMEVYVDEYFSCRPNPEYYEFLKLNFRQIESHYGSIVGLKLPIPKLIPVDKQKRA